MGDLRRYVEQAVRDFCDDRDIELTTEEFHNAASGVEYYIQEEITEIVSDSVSSAKY
jgi:hypothetical protein